MIALDSPVHEISDGWLYDVTGRADGEAIGQAVPAWVARLIACCDAAPVRVSRCCWDPAWTPAALGSTRSRARRPA